MKKLFKTDSDSDNALEDSKFLKGTYRKDIFKDCARPVVDEKNNKRSEYITVLYRNKKTFNRLRKSVGAVPRTSSMFDDDDDDLGFDPKHPKLGKQVDLFEELLKPNNAPIPQSSTTFKVPISRQSTATNSEASNMLNLTRTKTMAGRRSSNIPSSAPTIPDLEMGQMTGTSKATDSTFGTAKTSYQTNRGATANWLGLSMDALETTEGTHSQNVVDSSGPKTSQTPIDEELNDINSSDFGLLADIGHSTPNSTSKKIIAIKNLEKESNKTYTLSQQQENTSELLVRLHKQDETLSSLAQKNESLLQEQRSAYTSFIEQHLERQEKMQDFIEAQQKRIKAHLQLMTQPALPRDTPMLVFPSESQENMVRENPKEYNDLVSAVQKDIDIRRLELENERLEALIVNINASYEREIEALVTSYK